jgi:phage tail sheath gpL-like
MKMRMEESMSTMSPSLLVKSISVGGSTPGSLMRITVQVLPELFVSIITLSKGDTAVATSGTFKKGTSAKSPGSVDATVSAEHYDYIVTQKTNGEKLAVELHYTTRGSILDVFVEII